MVLIYGYFSSAGVTGDPYWNQTWLDPVYGGQPSFLPCFGDKRCPPSTHRHPPTHPFHILSSGRSVCSEGDAGHPTALIGAPFGSPTRSRLCLCHRYIAAWNSGCWSYTKTFATPAGQEGQQVRRVSAIFSLLAIL